MPQAESSCTTHHLRVSFKTNLPDRSLAQSVEQLAFNQWIVGSSRAKRDNSALALARRAMPQAESSCTTHHLRVSFKTNLPDRSLAQSVEQLAFNQWIVGSSRAKRDNSALALARRAMPQAESSCTTHHLRVSFKTNLPDGSLAQSVEQLAFNQWVVGSSRAKRDNSALALARRAMPQAGSSCTPHHLRASFETNPPDRSLAQSVAQLTFNQWVAGSSRAKRDNSASALARRARPQAESSCTTHHLRVSFKTNLPDRSLAQSVAQLAFNQLVVGSSRAKRDNSALALARRARPQAESSCTPHHLRTSFKTNFPG